MTITLPAPIQTYVNAGNTFDLETLAGAFAVDAFVNDARHEYWGIEAIHDWLARERRSPSRPSWTGSTTRPDCPTRWCSRITSPSATTGS